MYCNVTTNVGLLKFFFFLLLRIIVYEYYVEVDEGSPRIEILLKISTLCFATSSLAWNNKIYYQ